VSNQHQIGLGLQMYVSDFNDLFPVHDGGQRMGTAPATPIPPEPRPFTEEGVANQPSFESRHRQSKRFSLSGGQGRPIESIEFRRSGDLLGRMGNSYLIAWQANDFRVQYVTGSGGRIMAPSPPIRASVVAKKPSNKIIQGDWCWHGNRSVNNQQALAQ